MVFRYEVDGNTYTTSLIQFGETTGSGDSSDAELRRVRYPLGAAMTVRYMPGDPSIAAAEPGFHPDSLWLPGAGLAMFSIIFMLIGSAMLAGGFVRLWRGYESQQWPSATGVIVYGKRDPSAPVTTESEDERLVRASVGGPNLIFRHEVNGQMHFSNIRMFGQLAGADGDWEADIRARYPLGKAVRVAYSPENPHLGVLVPGVHNEAWYLPGAGAAFFLFGLAVLVLGIPALRD